MHCCLQLLPVQAAGGSRGSTDWFSSTHKRCRLSLGLLASHELQSLGSESVDKNFSLSQKKKKNHKNVEKLQSCYVISGNVMVHAIWKIVWQFVINLLYDSASPNLQIYPKESKTYLLKDSYNMFNAASLIKSYNVETL